MWSYHNLYTYIRLSPPPLIINIGTGVIDLVIILQRKIGTQIYPQLLLFTFKNSLYVDTSGDNLNNIQNILPKSNSATKDKPSYISFRGIITRKRRRYSG